MKQKVGILTFNRAVNYGAILQAYALKRVCENLGYEVYIVNYLNGKKEEKPMPLKCFINSERRKKDVIFFVRSLLSYSGDKRRWKEFLKFRNNYLNETNECLTVEDINKLDLDILISGSDQIWNYKITGDKFDSVYFGNIKTNAKCIVYAASAHDTPFPQEKEKEFKQQLISTVAPISIREQKLADYVFKLTNTKYPVVIDPTLLAGKEVFDSISEDKKTINPYILIYQIDFNSETDVSVKNLEKKFGIKVYTMTVPRIGSIHGRKGKYGPSKFLSLLRNAEFIVTNSFHGIALSVLLEKEFYVYENGGVMSRINNLLETLNLYDRKIQVINDIDLNKKINYPEVRRVLSKMRKSSLEILKHDLNIQNNSLIYRDKKECSGCSACVEICPVNAISMKEDREGFYYPSINATSCINCKKCRDICSFNYVMNREKNFDVPITLGIKHINETTRLTSRSGGAFIAFSDYVLEHGGIVYGAAMNDSLSVSHIRATSVGDRDKMKTAKYVQSNMEGIYSQVIKDLRLGYMVLFSGTPCQVAGLRTILDFKHIDSKKLICCDLVCHGVPSPKVWDDYTKHIEKKYKQKIINAQFRDKSFGWNTHYESFILSNGRKIVSRDYTDLFYEHIMFRPSCANCNFSNTDRVGDITLADFWGIEKNNESFNDNKGVSLVLINSSKGLSIFNDCKENLDWFECELGNCLQPTLVKPSKPSLKRESFWNDYNVIEFDKLLKKYTTPTSFKLKTKKKIKQIAYFMRIRKHP